MLTGLGRGKKKKKKVPDEKDQFTPYFTLCDGSDIHQWPVNECIRFYITPQRIPALLPPPLQSLFFYRFMKQIKMLRLWINFSRGGSKNIWVSVSDGVLYFGTGEWRSRNRSSFFLEKEIWLGFMPRLLFLKNYINLFSFFFFCPHTLDNLIFKLAKIEMRCVHICERLWDTNTLQTFSVLNIRSPAAAVARSHFSFFRQVLLWSYQGKVLIPKAFCAGFHYESPIFRKRSLWKENTPPSPSPLLFFFFHLQ